MPTLVPVPIITALYAGLLGLMSLVIAAVAGSKRGSTGIMIGDGGNIELVVAMRRHANFIEFAPLTLLLIGLLEMNGVASGAIHALGAALVVTRASHAYGFRGEDPSNIFRVIGAGGSMLVVLIASIWAIAVFF
jgi:hypothetical protein